jgi:Zn-dependent peptidase ImmA (M78 family)/transcriptional regulator with XRE-family HTH domain
MAAEFNHNLLLLARQYRGKSQMEVAAAADLNQGYYSRIESGILPEGPSTDNVSRISAALRFPVDFFFLPDGLSGLPLSVHPMNRRKSSVGEKTIRKIHAELNIRLIHLRRYLRAVELKPTLPLPRIDVDEGGGPNMIARKIRTAWGVPSGPIENLTDLCERAGILVIWCDLDMGIDGVAMSARDLPKCIFLNRHSTADRMRFSLAHELGHTIMHSIPTDHIEDEANAFASELLVPESQFRKSIIGQKITLEWLARQKAYWKASMAFLLYKSTQIDALTRHQSEYLWKKISSLGWRTREPEETDFDYELPSVFPRLLSVHADHLNYDVEGLARLVSASAEDVSEIYGAYLPQSKPKLRLVK